MTETAHAIARGNGDVIVALVIGFLVVDAVAIALIWLAVRRRRMPPGGR